MQIQHTHTRLRIQCETPELRFLKCSIKWDVLTSCFSPVSASLLHSFYSLENTTLSLAYFPSPSPLFYILVFSFLLFFRFLWVVVFSLVIMTEPYASHDASEIEHTPDRHTPVLEACRSPPGRSLWAFAGWQGHTWKKRTHRRVRLLQRKSRRLWLMWFGQDCR